MMKKALACMMFLGVVFSLAAAADDTSLIFNRGIGVIPVSNVSVSSTGTVTVTPNMVRGQTPGGQIWVIDELNAQVSVNGNIRVNGKGLVRGGGDNAGEGGVNVYATLSCLDTGSYGLSSTSFVGVPVSPNGNFQINGMLSPKPTFPCASPLLLIQSASNAHWFALGLSSDR
jgi:hypothetical protein